MNAVAEKIEADSLTTAIAPGPRRYTYDELLAEMGETNQPHELWDGELFKSPTPSFFHQQISFRFHNALNLYIRERDLGEVVGSPIDMVLSKHRTTQPDVAFISKERLSIIKRVIMGPVDLAVEVISLEGRRRDRIDKRDLYEQYGIKEYWIIDPEAETVDVLTLINGAYQLAMRVGIDGIASSRLLPGFQMSCETLFRPRIGE